MRRIAARTSTSLTKSTGRGLGLTATGAAVFASALAAAACGGGAGGTAACRPARKRSTARATAQRTPAPDSGAAAATAGGRKVPAASMAGTPASMTGQTFLGAVGGGLPWRLERGATRLFSDGRLQVQVVGLVLDAGANAGTNPIREERGLVSCGGTVGAMSSTVT